MKRHGLVFLVSLVVGCAQFSTMKWSELQAFGNVSLGEPAWQGDRLIVPVQVAQKSGDSMSVLTFRAHVDGESILISAKRQPVDSGAVESRDIVITLPKQHLNRYRVFYENPDGSREQMQQLSVPDRAGTET